MRRRYCTGARIRGGASVDVVIIQVADTLSSVLIVDIRKIIMEHRIIKVDRHYIETPLKDLNCGDIVEIIDESGNICGKAVAVAWDSCCKCPLFSGRICEFYWKASDGTLHGACESGSSTDDPNAKDIRFFGL
jgi:hypothetical protein